MTVLASPLLKTSYSNVYMRLKFLAILLGGLLGCCFVGGVSDDATTSKLVAADTLTVKDTELLNLILTIFFFIPEIKNKVYQLGASLKDLEFPLACIFAEFENTRLVSTISTFIRSFPIELENLCSPGGILRALYLKGFQWLKDILGHRQHFEKHFDNVLFLVYEQNGLSIDLPIPASLGGSTWEHSIGDLLNGAEFKVDNQIINRTFIPRIDNALENSRVNWGIPKNCLTFELGIPSAGPVLTITINRQRGVGETLIVPYPEKININSEIFLLHALIYENEQVKGHHHHNHNLSTIIHTDLSLNTWHMFDHSRTVIVTHDQVMGHQGNVLLILYVKQSAYEEWPRSPSPNQYNNPGPSPAVIAAITNPN